MTNVTLTTEQAQQIEEALEDIVRVFKFETGTPVEALAVIRDARAEQAEQEPEYKGWYCAHCERGVDGSEVTFHEQHEVCGRVITNDVPPKPAQQEPVAIMSTNKANIVGINTPYANIGTDDWIKLYAAPVQQVDLTDDEIADIFTGIVAYKPTGYARDFARAVLAADRELNR